MKTKLSLVIFFFYSVLCLSQNNGTIAKVYVSSRNQEIHPSTIEKVMGVKISDYQGSYSFGESEGESVLGIIYSNGKLFARSSYTDFKNDLGLRYERDPIEYLNGKIKIGKTFFELFQCVETTSFTLNKGTKGLVLHFFENEDGKKYHYMQFSPDYPESIKLKGKYPEASFVKLSIEDLNSYSKNDLKIIRNEIFARKGYIFREGGEMEKYFSQQIWYKRLKNRTNNIKLSDIEKHNVDLILKLEKK